MSQKELNKLIEDLFAGLINVIVKLIKGTFWGVKKLNKKINILLFLVSVVIGFMGYIFRHKFNAIPAPVYIKYATYYLFLFFPLLFLFVLGNSQDRLQNKFVKIFSEINFIGSDKKYPYLIKKHTDGKKVILLFKSMIPLQEWKKAREKLETGLDCNILLLQEGKSKKIVELTTVPSDCRIPEKIEWSNDFIQSEEGVIAVGESALGIVKFDLNKTPHILIAGETGSGKSVILRTIIKQFIVKGHKIYMIDFKGGVEFGVQYEKYGEVITDRSRAISLLTQLVSEMNRRLDLFRSSQVKNLGEYNKKTGENLQRVGVFCDEVAEMLDKKGASKELKEQLDILDGLISSLARLARATGIDLIIGIQRPDANVLTGQIKNNIPVRICGRFADKPASEIVLGNTLAVDLPQIQGRFLYKLGNDTAPFQAYYFDDDTMLDGEDNDENKNEKYTKNSKPRKILKKNPIKKANTTKRQAEKVQESDNFDTSVFDEEITWSVKEEKEEVNEELEFNFDFSVFNHSEIESDEE